MPAEIDIDHRMGGQSRSRWIDRAIAALAGLQHGVVARWQLRGLDVSARAIERRIEAARLHVIYPGVYAVGHRKLSREGRWMAAVLAGGEGAVLMRESAATFQGFADLERRTIHVNGAGRDGPKGVRMHRADLVPDEVTTKHGIRVTTPARTLLDLATTTNEQRLERAVREALFQHQTSLPALRRVVSRHRGHRGVRALRQAIERVADAPGRIRSNPEQRFLGWLRKRALPMPELNVHMRIGELKIEADCYWREQGVIVEIDDHGTHARRHAFESDRIRDRTLQAHGLKAVRVTEPYDDALYADLGLLLSARRRELQARRR